MGFNPVTCVVSPGWGADCYPGSFLAAARVTSPRWRGSCWSARSRAAARTNELDADERRTIMDSEERGPSVLAYEGSWLSPGVAGGVVSQAPIRRPRRRAGLGAMTICSGTGLLSHVIERGLLGRLMPHERACPGLGDLPLVFGSVAGGTGGAGGLGGGEQVVGAGQQLAGDRDGGDLLPAPFGDRGVGGGELRGALGGLCRLVEDPPQPRRALLGDVTVPDSQVRAADCRCQPGPAGQLAGAGEAGDVTDLGQRSPAR